MQHRNFIPPGNPWSEILYCWGVSFRINCFNENLACNQQQPWDGNYWKVTLNFCVTNISTDWTVYTCKIALAEEFAAVITSWYSKGAEKQQTFGFSVADQWRFILMKSTSEMYWILHFKMIPGPLFRLLVGLHTALIKFLLQKLSSGMAQF